MTKAEALKQAQFTTSVMALLMDEYGTEFFNWDPDTTEIAIVQDMSVEYEEALEDKIHTGTLLLSSNMFHRSFEAWSCMCQILSDGFCVKNMFIPPALDDVLWGHTEALLIQGAKDYKNMEFTHDIARYVGIKLQEAGVFIPPDIVEFVEYPEQTIDILKNNIFPVDIESELFYERQYRLRDELHSSLKLKTAALFDELSRLPIKSNNEFIEKALSKLTATSNQ